MSAHEVFTGDRLVHSSMTDTWYVVTSWSNHPGNLVEAHVKRVALPEEFERINDRRELPNQELEVEGKRFFRCRECTVTFPDSGGLVKDSCPGCGEHVGFIHGRTKRYAP